MQAAHFPKCIINEWKHFPAARGFIKRILLQETALHAVTWAKLCLMNSTVQPEWSSRMQLLYC